jgi:modulator of FtsH protease HflC
MGHNHSHCHDDHVHKAKPGPGAVVRCLVAGILVAVAVAAASLVQVRSGEATVVTRLGNPVRVLLQPGLEWHLPAPIEATIPVDLRLKTTSSGLQDVGTRDGLRMIAKAFVVWQVSPHADRVGRFLRAVRNQPDDAAEHIRSLMASSLEIAASSFDLSALINTDADKVLLGDFEAHLRDQIADQLLDVYGIEVLQVGLDRLSLPAVTLNATVQRMRAERETIAAKRTAEAQRTAAEIRSKAESHARMALADGAVQAADIEAKSRSQAAEIYGRAYRQDPALYTELRSLDTLDTVVTANTDLILRTDAAPFHALVEGPPSPTAKVQ